MAPSSNNAHSNTQSDRKSTSIMNHQQKRQSFETSSRYHDDDEAKDINHDIHFIESKNVNSTNINFVVRNKKRTARRIVKNSTIWKSLFLMVLIGFILYFKKEEKNSVITNSQHQQIDDSERRSYCYDSDDSKESIEKFVNNPSLCSCFDPELPAPRDGESDAWHLHHNTIVQDAVYHQRKQQLNEEVIDFILVGDSITERWNGTRSNGKFPLPEYRTVFNKYFNKYDNTNASLFGLALGASGDVAVELSWHLENGILSSSINPKVFAVLIGTNDIGRTNCSKQTVLKGIKNVIGIIHTSRPETPIIVHSLLPRSDNYKRIYKTGWIYNRIIWINNELQKFCDLKTNNMWCYYLNINHIFLTESLAIKKELMDDALHPTVKGCDIWGPLLVDEIKKRIKE